LDNFWWKRQKEKKHSNSEHDITKEPKGYPDQNHETASLQNDPGGIIEGGVLSSVQRKSLDDSTSASQQCTQLDYRSRLQNLAFIFSLPHLVMLSNLQKLIGIRTGKKPSIQPNEYMDNLLENARATMRERGLNSVKLPDQNQGVALYNGKMTGLDNLTRSGDALLEADSDHFLLSFAIEANNIKANYWWKKQRLKGEVSAVVNQVTMKMKIKQMIQNSPPPELLAFTVEKIDGIHVSIHGLGPLNWIVRRVLRALLRRHLREYLEREGRDVVQQELQNATVASEGDNLFTMLPQLVMY